MISKQAYQLSLLLFSISILLLFMSCYYFGYGYLRQHQLTITTIDSFIWHVQKETAVFSMPYMPSLIIIILISIGLLFNQSSFHHSANRNTTSLISSICMIIVANLVLTIPSIVAYFLYVFLQVTGLLLYISAIAPFIQLLHLRGKDQFNSRNEQFQQEVRKLVNPLSVNIATSDGCINVVNPCAGTLITGVPGSGKSYVFVQEYIDQLIAKGFSACVYDYKGDLTKFVYNATIINHGVMNSNRGAHFAVLDFDNPIYSIRINPLSPKLLLSQEDCVDAATIFYMNLNKSYARKKGDFFLESARLLIACGILFLRYSTLSTKTNKGGVGGVGNCCTVPHLVALICNTSPLLFDVMAKKKETKIMFSLFSEADKKDAHEQLEGQTASARIALSLLATPNIFWALSGHDINLAINQSELPTILCLKNNIQREEAYSPAIGLIIGQLIKVINQPGNRPCLVSVDEASTIFIKKLDQLIATARSNKVAVQLTFQDFAQLIRDYGKEVADVIINTMGNRITGRVVRETAKDYEALFGKVVQQRYSQSESRGEVNNSISSSLDSLLPASKIANFSQGEFAGSLVDTMEQSMPIKIFRSKIVVSKKRWIDYQLYNLPVITPLSGNIQKIVDDNFDLINQEVKDLLNESYANLK